MMKIFDRLKSINKDSDIFERNTPGAFILCTNEESLRIVRDEILKQIEKDSRITFNLISTGSKFEKVVKFLKEKKEFDECIKNYCIYCWKPKDYLHLKVNYPKLHNDIYKKKKDIIQFIEKYSSKDIKPYPLTKLVTYHDYVSKYKERHFKISQFYGNLNKESFVFECFRLIPSSAIKYNGKFDVKKLSKWIAVKVGWQEWDESVDEVYDKSKCGSTMYLLEVCVYWRY